MNVDFGSSTANVVTVVIDGQTQPNVCAKNVEEALRKSAPPEILHGDADFLSLHYLLLGAEGNPPHKLFFKTKS